MNALRIAIDLFGSQALLAKEIGVSPQVISNWIKRGNIPAEYCPDIDRATNGRVRCEELRPDLESKWAYLRGTKKETV